MGFRQPPADGFHHIHGHAVARLLVKLGVGLKRDDLVNPFILPALQPQAFPWRQTADALPIPYPGGFSFVVMGYGLPRIQAPGIFRKFRVLVHIHKAQDSLIPVSREGMGDLSPNPAAAGIGGGICQVDAVAGIRHGISLFGVLLDGQAHFIQAGFPAEAAWLRREGTAYSFRGVDSFPLGSGADLDKRRSCCFGERKYFSSASLIKISDKIHPFSGLGDPKIFAVKHLPFHKIPQSVQRMEDGRKRPAPVMVKQSGYVFKQQIRRSFCLSQPGNFKEQGTSWIVESSTVSSNRKRLAGKSAAQQVEVGDAVWIGFSDIFTKPLSFCIEQGFIALVCLFVDFAMAYAGKPSGAGEPFPEPADAGEQVNISYGFLYHAPFEGFDESLKHNQWTSPLFRELKSI